MTDFHQKSDCQNCANNAPGRIHLTRRRMTTIRDATAAAAAAAAAGNARQTPSALGWLLKSTEES